MGDARRFRAWPLLLMGAPAAVAIWSGWVGLGGMAGFGPIRPLPGILPHVVINTAITLPVGVEAYGAYALGAWLRPGTPPGARRFARWSAIGALLLGGLGQVAYHLLAAVHAVRAPWPVIVAVSCIPVVALGFGAALAHLLGSGGEAVPVRPLGRDWLAVVTPVASALAGRLAPPRGHHAAVPGEHPSLPVAAPPVSTPREKPAVTSREAKPAAPASAVARVRRKGPASAADEEVRAAIRELRADDPAVTTYKVTKELKGSKGGIGDVRAARLLAEVLAERPGLHAVAE